MKTNKLVQGALITALFGVLAVLNTMTGTMFDSLIGYGMAIPMAIYSYKTGLKEALMTSLASMVICFPIWNTQLCINCPLITWYGNSCRTMS